MKILHAIQWTFFKWQFYFPALRVFTHTLEVSRASPAFLDIINWSDVSVWLQDLSFRTRLPVHTDHPNQQVEQHHIRVHGVQRPGPLQTSQNCRLLPQLSPHRTSIPHSLRAVNIVRSYTWMPRYFISKRSGKLFHTNPPCEMTRDLLPVRSLESEQVRRARFLPSGKSAVLQLHMHR